MKVIHSATNSGACRDGIKIKKIRNNQKCPCESGKKYKKCCKKNVILNKVHKLHSWRMEDDKQGRMVHWWAQSLRGRLKFETEDD